MRNFKVFWTVLLLAFIVGGASAAPANNMGKNVPLFSAGIDFSDLPNSQYDSQFNEAIFSDIVRTALVRNGLSIDGTARGKYHLVFSAYYVYFVGNVEYRFASFAAFMRDNEGHSLCDVNQAAWWGGRSGAVHIRSTAESFTNAFFKVCKK